MDRSTFLTLGASVSVALATGDAFELVRTGKPNDTLRGVGLIAGFPIVLWGLDRVSQDHYDKASWAVTIASSALVAYSLWPLVDRYILGHKDDTDEEAKARSTHVGPTAIVGPHGTANIGVGFVATFD